MDCSGEDLGSGEPLPATTPAAPKDDRVRLVTVTSEPLIKRSPSTLRFLRNAMLLPTLLMVVLVATSLKPRLPIAFCLASNCFRAARAGLIFVFGDSSGNI